MDKFLKFIGAMIFAAVLMFIPMLCVLADAYDWGEVLFGIGFIGTILEYILLMSVLFDLDKFEYKID